MYKQLDAAEKHRYKKKLRLVWVKENPYVSERSRTFVAWAAHICNENAELNINGS